MYEAENRLLQEVHVALKTILPHVADEPALQKRFGREVLLAARQFIQTSARFTISSTPIAKRQTSCSSP